MRFMRIFDRSSVLRTTAPAREVAIESATRWGRARDASPGIVEDLVRLGGILAMQPASYADGVALPDPIDPGRLAYEAGRRDLAVQLLTLAGIDSYDLMNLMENKDVR